MPRAGEFLLDTNVIIAFLARDPAVTARVEAATEVVVSSVALGELYYGAHKSVRIDDNIARVDELARENRVVACDDDTARIYGDLKNRLRQRARPIPENDVWIAALAVQHDLTLVTRDAHFAALTELSLEDW
jgi:tRNA(fMet)-specific endonuclease VapC